jgi:hypothetical protein
MKKAAFARFVGISRQMVSKYADDGRLVMAGDRVDARASLARLEGHLDENKRRAALLKLAGIDPGALGPLGGGAAASGDGDPGGAAASAAAAGGDGKIIDFTAASWRARRERAQAIAAEIDLDERFGHLLCAEEVKKSYEDTIATYWSEVERMIRPVAAEIASALKLDAEQAAEQRRLIETAFIRPLRQNISAAMRRMAAEAEEERADALTARAPVDAAAKSSE